jgi:hypothetical protein
MRIKVTKQKTGKTRTYLIAKRKPKCSKVRNICVQCLKNRAETDSSYCTGCSGAYSPLHPCPAEAVASPAVKGDC